MFRQLLISCKEADNDDLEEVEDDDVGLQGGISQR